MAQMPPACWLPLQTPAGCAGKGPGASAKQRPV